MKYFILLIVSITLLKQNVNSQNLWQATGNIGIGTEVPTCWFSDSYVLDIKGNRPVLKLNSLSDIATIFFTCPSVNSTTRIGEFHLNYIFNRDDNSKSRLAFGTYPAGHALNVLSNGNVGIGTITPQNSLDVNGIIRAKEIKVETSWADYVFYPSYQLKPLIEVERFIKANGHLQDIPSAAEVEQNGVNVGEMQSKLLQKVEEVTLYLIEQSKQLEALKKENELLKQENKINTELLLKEINDLKSKLKQ